MQSLAGPTEGRLYRSSKTDLFYCLCLTSESLIIVLYSSLLDEFERQLRTKCRFKKIKHV